MQTPRARHGSAEVPQRTSPSSQPSQKSSPSTNRTSRQIKVARLGSDSVDSSNSTNRTPKNRSPKVLERRSPQSPITEKKRISKLSDLESQLTQREDDLAKTKDQLNSSETLKQRALQETKEMKKQFAIMSARLEESQQQLHEFSTSEDARIQELRNLSQERDRVWQSEVEAIQKQHSMDSTALASALNEIQKLKGQLEMASDAKATHSWHTETAHGEIECLRNELSETVSLVENMRKQFSDSKESEVQALNTAREAQMQLEEAMTITESLRSEGLKAKEAYDNLSLELEKSKEKAISFEILVKELEEKLENKSNNSSGEIMLEEDNGGEKEGTETIELKAEHDALKLEVDQLKSALAASELRYQEEYIQSTMQIRNTFDEVERTKLEIGARETELEAELKKARSTIDELESKLNKERNAKLEENDISAEKSELEMELKTLKGDLQDLKAVMLDKEIQIQNYTKEHEMLKAVIKKRGNEQGVSSAETAKAAENEAMIKLGNLTEEAEKRSRKAARVAEQLEAVQKENTELETELRKLKVQSDQWRKAAEAAAAMLSNGSDAKFVGRIVSFNSIAAKMESPLLDDINDDDPKKKNGNMLKKFGVLWKKGQK